MFKRSLKRRTAYGKRRRKVVNSSKFDYILQNMGDIGVILKKSTFKFTNSNTHFFHQIRNIAKLWLYFAKYLAKFPIGAEIHD